MDSLTRALDQNRALMQRVYDQTLMQKNVTGNLVGDPGFGGLLGGPSRGDRRRYDLYKGWLYAAVNALASEGAGQPVTVSQMLGVPSREQASGRFRTKHFEEDVLVDHPLLDVIERPNPIQGRWQFVYSFIANLQLTGWSYVVAGEGQEGETELYSLPTTWIQPDHTEGPFTRFKLRNPKKTDSSQQVFLDRSQVGFAHLPNPSDPLSALPPAATQIESIEIDEFIKNSQRGFFRNGHFPSMVVVVGKNPHPEVSGGLRPRLNRKQRSQVYTAIQKTTGGIANYGRPAIVDGMIEKFERLSATQNEMGWEKSEDKVRDRILSAFGVHPFILGMALSVGGYAQAAKIEERFCKRVNTMLNMLSNLMTTFAAPLLDDQVKIVVKWEECKPHDPELERKWWIEARKNKDVTKNEFRAKLGLPALEEEQGTRTALLDTAGGMTGTVQILSSTAQGFISSEAASLLLQQFLGLDASVADQIAQQSEGVSAEQLQDTLNSLVEEIKRPVRVQLDDDGAVERLADSLKSQSRAQQKNRRSLERLSRQASELQHTRQLADTNSQWRQEVASLQKGLDQILQQARQPINIHNNM